MIVRDLIGEITERAAWNGSSVAEVAALREALDRFADLPVLDFCHLLAKVRIPKPKPPAKPKSPKKAAKTDAAKIEHFVRLVEQAIDNMTSDDISLEYLKELAAKLDTRAYNKDEVVEIARKCGVTTARTKKDGVERLRQKLVDLKSTLTKTRMYG